MRGVGEGGLDLRSVPVVGGASTRDGPARGVPADRDAVEVEQAVEGAVLRVTAATTWSRARAAGRSARCRGVGPGERRSAPGDAVRARRMIPRSVKVAMQPGARDSSPSQRYVSGSVFIPWNHTTTGTTRSTSGGSVPTGSTGRRSGGSDPDVRGLVGASKTSSTPRRADGSNRLVGHAHRSRQSPKSSGGAAGCVGAPQPATSLGSMPSGSGARPAGRPGRRSTIVRRSRRSRWRARRRSSAGTARPRRSRSSHSSTMRCPPRPS